MVQEEGEISLGERVLIVINLLRNCKSFLGMNLQSECCYRINTARQAILYDLSIWKLPLATMTL